MVSAYRLRLVVMLVMHVIGWYFCFNVWCLMRMRVNGYEVTHDSRSLVLNCWMLLIMLHSFKRTCYKIKAFMTYILTGIFKVVHK